MKSSGFIPESIDGYDNDINYFEREIVNDMVAKGILRLYAIDVSNKHGVCWEIDCSEIKRLEKRVSDLEDTNARLYRLITDEANRREARRIM